MLAIIDMKKLFEFTQTQYAALLELTAKDRIILIASPGDSLPVDMIPVISQIKAKLEICKLAKDNDPFERGFLYGSLSQSSGKDPVIVISDEKAPASLPANCSWNDGLGIKPKKKSASPERKQGKAASPSPEIKTAKTSKTTDLLDSPLLAEVLPLIKGNEDKFRRCLSESSDGEIGYPMILNLYFGEDGNKIFELTRKNYKKLRKLSETTDQLA